MSTACTFAENCCCLRCLRRVYADTRKTVTEAAASYAETRRKHVQPEKITVARQVWTEARYALVLADSNLRAAEDEEFLAEQQDEQMEAVRWMRV